MHTASLIFDRRKQLSQVYKVFWRSDDYVYVLFFDFVHISKLCARDRRGIFQIWAGGGLCDLGTEIEERKDAKAGETGHAKSDTGNIAW